MIGRNPHFYKARKRRGMKFNPPPFQFRTLTCPYCNFSIAQPYRTKKDMPSEKKCFNCGKNYEVKEEPFNPSRRYEE